MQNLIGAVMTHGQVQPILIEDNDGDVLVIQLKEEENKLLSDIDSMNGNDLKRSTSLDLADMHHCLYLVRYSMKNMTLSHKEAEDFENFNEKMSVSDRVGRSGCGEICAFKSRICMMAIDSQSTKKRIFESGKCVSAEWIHSNINYVLEKEDMRKIFTNGYRDSPKHYEIIINEKFKKFGSCTFLVYSFTQKNLEHRRSDFLNYIEKCRVNGYSKSTIDRCLREATEFNSVLVVSLINVTVFDEE